MQRKYTYTKDFEKANRIYWARTYIARDQRKTWVTDISYIHTQQGVLYLSVIRNLYDNSIDAYKTGTEQNINFYEYN